MNAIASKNMNAIQSLGKIFNHLEELLLGYSIIAMASLTVAQIFTRTFFSYGFGWIEQVGGHVLVMVTLLGASIGVKQDKHFKMGALIENLPVRIRQGIGIITNLCCSLFFIVVIYQGFIQTYALYDYGTTTSALGMPFFIVYLPIPLFSIGIVIRYGIAAYNDAMDFNKEER